MEPEGRPQKVGDEDGLIEAIVNIVMTGSASGNKWRTGMICSVKSLDDLTEELHKQGYNLSRSSVYLTLLPNRSLSHEERDMSKLLLSNSSEHKIRNIPVMQILNLQSQHSIHWRKLLQSWDQRR